MKNKLVLTIIFFNSINPTKKSVTKVVEVLECQ